jgi:RimJ/RimL family protein N-acetyltransferase/predicted enzyme related to lactoylglutathione lyase
MSEEIEVREIQEEDAEAFLDLLTRIDAETDFMLVEAGERATTVMEQRERIKGLLSKENQTVLVASRTEQLVGYLAAIGGEFRRNRHRAYLVVGVLQAFTGRQIGTRLFTALEIWARRHGIERLELTVRTDNERGTGLYRKMGFEIEGLKRRSLKVKGRCVNEYYMAKILEHDALQPISNVDVTRTPLRTTFAHPTPELPVADVERAQQHYRDALGFEIGWLIPEGDIGAVSRDDAAIFFRRRGRPFEPAVHWVFAADIDATYEELRSRGARIVESLEKKPWGLRQFTVEDIDGNRFYFHCD